MYKGVGVVTWLADGRRLARMPRPAAWFGEPFNIKYHYPMIVESVIRTV